MAGGDGNTGVCHPGREATSLASPGSAPSPTLTHTHTLRPIAPALCWRKPQWRPGVAWVTKGPAAGGGRGGSGGGSGGGAGGGAGLAGNGAWRAEASGLAQPELAGR